MPPSQDPRPIPNMKADSTIETTWALTPNEAIASRSQMISYTRLQKPDSRKQAKANRLKIVSRFSLLVSRFSFTVSRLWVLVLVYGFWFLVYGFGFMVSGFDRTLQALPSELQLPA